MAVTKRVRFEVLRRDNHTCQYCGAKAPDVVLHIDHVMPVSLGGDDKPGNLVTACKDCNAGKTSITPDSPLVAGLSDRAAAYALGMIDKMTRLRQDLESLDKLRREFHRYWDEWKFTSGPREGQSIPLPGDYELSLLRWQQLGVPLRVIDLAIKKAMNKPGLRGEYGEFQYMAGVITGMLDAREIDLTLTSDTVAVYTQAEHMKILNSSYWTAFDSGERRGRRNAMILDPLRNHVDGTRLVWDEAFEEWGLESIGTG